MLQVEPDFPWKNRKPQLFGLLCVFAASYVVRAHCVTRVVFPAGNYGVETYLELFSEDNFDAFCLAYMFTYRDFEGGTLGLAWTGDLQNAGGVCEKNGVRLSILAALAAPSGAGAAVNGTIVKRCKFVWDSVSLVL